VGTSARAFCAKGRALAMVEGRDREAEELLSKALKLNPQLLEAWNALGEVYWDRQRYQEARGAFEQAVEMCGPHATSLRNLSMVLRALECDDLEKSVNFAAGLQKAKDATVLDANDPQNWETLGNAYMGEFFVNGKRVDELNKALIAYARADSASEKLGKRNPTLHINRGKAAMFLEDYALALKSFRTAHSISGSANARALLERVLELVRRLAGLIERKGDLKAKRLKEVTVGLPADAGSLEQLRTAGGAASTLGARVVSVIDRKDDTPVILICCDAAGQFFALSMYNAEQLKVAEALVPLQSVVMISKPHFRQVAVKDTEVELSYPNVRVAHPGDVAVVGGSNLAATAAKPAFTSERASQAPGGS